ncbi:Uncharacterised protein [Bordetella pseudohinzii]|uniref:Uncharacterized protein n=1 Tax=Bordetella pseudohinzii TaxID=1331258 RepID=A0A0M7GPN6_9BORD|nr:Uncharacterised protein [Bordetella pseudohinzii]
MTDALTLARQAASGERRAVDSLDDTLARAGLADYRKAVP